MFNTLTFPDWSFLVLCLFGYVYRYRYDPPSGDDNGLVVGAFAANAFVFFVLVYVCILLPAQIGFNKIFGTFFLVGMICVTIPAVIAIFIWEQKPKALLIYAPVLFVYYKFLQSGFF